MFHLAKYFVVVFSLILQLSSRNSPSALFGSVEKEIAWDGSTTDARPGLGPYIQPELIPISKPQYIPQCNTAGESIFANEPSVALFTKKFREAIYSTDILRELFDLRPTTAKEFADFARAEYEKLSSEIGCEKEVAASLAEFAFRAITPNFDVLTLAVLSQTFANTAASFFLVNGALGMDNAEGLAMTYAQFLAESALDKMNYYDTTSKFPVLFDGCNFLLSVVGNTQANAALLAYNIGNEWFLSAVNY